jgi:hypothetical protein
VGERTRIVGGGGGGRRRPLFEWCLAKLPLGTKSDDEDDHDQEEEHDDEDEGD